jgi:hypothetical protein
LRDSSLLPGGCDKGILGDVLQNINPPIFSLISHDCFYLLYW